MTKAESLFRESAVNHIVIYEFNRYKGFVFQACFYKQATFAFLLIFAWIGYSIWWFFHRILPFGA